MYLKKVLKKLLRSTFDSRSMFCRSKTIPYLCRQSVVGRSCVYPHIQPSFSNMAIGNIVLGTATGKMGPLVMYHDGGQQITRTNSGKNSSRTYAQVKQRIRFCNPSLFYRLAHNAFFRFAYDDQRPNETEYNAFMRYNLMNDTVWLTKKQFESGFFVAAPYAITRGPLQNITAPATGGAIKIPFTADVRQNTWGKISQRLLDYHKSLQVGDLLTIVGAVSSYSSDGMAFDIWQRIIDPTSTEATTYNMLYRSDAIIMSNGTGGISFVWKSAGAIGVVVSRNTPKGVICTNTDMILNDASRALYLPYIRDNAMKAAIDSYGYQQAILNPKGKK